MCCRTFTAVGRETVGYDKRTFIFVVILEFQISVNMVIRGLGIRRSAPYDMRILGSWDQGISKMCTVGRVLQDLHLGHSLQDVKPYDVTIGQSFLRSFRMYIRGSEDMEIRGLKCDHRTIFFAVILECIYGDQRIWQSGDQKDMRHRM